MSRLYEALRMSEEENQQKGGVVAATVPEPVPAPAAEAAAQSVNLETVRSVRIYPGPEARLVALTQEQGLGAEKFRVLATRLMNLRPKQELKSVQLLSSVIDEGKTLVAVNLATTLARRYRQRVLLVDGDMRRPGLPRLFGSATWKGLTQWWTEKNASLASYLCRLPDLSLWFLPSGGPFEQPTEVLQSARLSEALTQLTQSFDWAIVDSTPMVPMADANLWSRIVDGTLLVIREGVTPVKALKKGLTSLDNLKLIGIVLNEASESEHASYYENYCTVPPGDRNGQKRGLAEESKA